MAKTLCDWSKKDIQAKPERLAAIVADPRFYCAKCARSANDARRLCKARKLPQVFASPDGRSFS